MLHMLVKYSPPQRIRTPLENQRGGSIRHHRGKWEASSVSRKSRRYNWHKKKGAGVNVAFIARMVKVIELQLSMLGSLISPHKDKLMVSTRHIQFNSYWIFLCSMPQMQARSLNQLIWRSVYCDCAAAASRFHGICYSNMLYMYRSKNCKSSICVLFGQYLDSVFRSYAINTFE